MKQDMKAYYRKRAPNYDQGMYYRDDPVRQKEIRLITNTMQGLFRDKEILEIACGTGHWTQVLSHVAKHIVATDAVNEVLQIAKEKTYHCPVTFQKENAYRLAFADNTFTGGVANFWFSHIHKKDIKTFIDEFHRSLQNGAIVFFCDNVISDGSDSLLVRKKWDTYRLRTLKSGEQYLVVKNYYTREELKSIFSPYAREFNDSHIVIGQWAWYMWYELKK